MRSPEHPVDRKYRVLVALLLSALGLLLQVDMGEMLIQVGGEVYALIHDDAMIILRVADQFASGNGPYFNPPETVAANTSLTWPVLLAPLFLVFDNSSAVLGAAAGSLLLTIATFSLVLVLGEDRVSSMLAVVVLVVSPPVLYYSWSAFEQVPAMMLVTAALLVLVRRSLIRGFDRYIVSFALLVMAALVRPNVALLASVPGLYLLRRYVKDRRTGDLVALISGATAVLCYYLTHHLVYGTFIPNTAHLKVEPGISSLQAGLSYIAGGLTTGAGAIFPLTLGLLWLFNRTSLPVRYRVAVGTCAAHFAYVAAVGGDAFPYGRFWLIILPGSVYLTALILKRYVFEQKNTVAAATIATYVIAAAIPITLVVGRTEYQMRQASQGQLPNYSASETVTLSPSARQSQVALVDVIRRNLAPADGRIGVFYAGALPYYLPQYQMADFLGLADPVIARMPVRWGPPGHNKWDIASTLKRHQVAAIPYSERRYREPREYARRRLQRREPYAFWSDLRLSERLDANFTYLPPDALGSGGDWGLYVRDSLVDRFADDRSNPNSE